MSEQSPSQAEGERDDEERENDGASGRPLGHPNPRHTPSQAEGERDDETDAGSAGSSE